jgi:hypothetical protein
MPSSSHLEPTGERLVSKSFEIQPKGYRVKTASIVPVLILVPLFLAVLSGSKQYAIWSQITYLWDAHADPIQQLSEVSPHSLRYALMYPLLIFAESFRVDQDKVFSIMVVAICYLTGRNILSTIKILDPRPHNALVITFFVMAMTEAIFFLMNGRISLAFFGYSILLRTIVKVSYHRIVSWKVPILLLFALFLCGVSSGTLFSAGGTLAITVLFEFSKSLRRLQLNKVSLFLILTAVSSGYFFLKFILVGLIKNLLFYGGGYAGFLSMLQHGFGGVLYPFVSILSLQELIALVLFCTLFFSFVLSRFTFSFLLHILVGTIAFGAFGFSTLTLSFMPMMVLLSLKLKRIRLNR